MDETFERIAGYINKHTEKFYNGMLLNTSDLYLPDNIDVGYQLIFGVTNSDIHNADIQHYEFNIKQQLEYSGLEPKFLAFPYSEKEILIEALEKLSDNYDAHLDIKRLIRDIDFKNDRPVYIVITIIKFPIINPQKG